MGTSTATGLKDTLKVNGAVEAQAAIIEDINPVSLVVSRSVDDGNLVQKQLIFIYFVPCDGKDC